jgi:predicted metal-dependent HD superfamily phosphohydrolase/putative intracellular protease/amidase
MSQTRNLAILIFDDVEVLDFCGPFEVFSVANRFTDAPALNVVTVAEKPGPVLTRGGLSVNPHHRLPDCPRPDLLLVPGGQGTRKEMHNPALIDWIKQASNKAELVLSVCTGALLLAKAGLLDGLEATTHHGGIDLLRQTARKTTVHADRRFVDNGRVVCSAGIAAGIDMSLHVLGRLLGREVAEKTARRMEYPWKPSGIDEMRENWHDLLRAWAVDRTHADQKFDEVCKFYAGPGRFYHTLDHVQNVLKSVQSLGPSPRNLNAVKLAAWLHDVIYDSRASDNEERSAEYAQRLCEELSIPEGHLVASLIQKTKTHHAGGDADAEVLLDADLAILGASETIYRTYSEKIRQEYAWVPEPEYRKGRQRVLQDFLSRPRIFHLLCGLEAPARQNLAAEIAQLAVT